MTKTCFVIMAIGTQKIGDKVVDSSDLKDIYSNLIKEAILKNFPEMDIARADEVAMPGSINSDIITKIIHSDFVIADVTYPNPNVFYELGLRHATRSGTVIIKDRSAPGVPFDIAGLRYTEYDNTLSGLRDLAEKLKDYIGFSMANPDKPDNHFLEYAKYTKLKSYDYSDKDEEVDSNTEMISAILSSPELVNLLINSQNGQEINQIDFIQALASNPEASGPVIRAIAKSSMQPQTQAKPNQQTRRRKN